MKLRRLASAVAFLYLSGLAVGVLGRSFAGISPDTAIAVEDNYERAESSRISWSFSRNSLGLQQLRIPLVHLHTLNPFTQERRSLRNVHVRDDVAGDTGGGTGGDGLSTAEIVIIIVSSVSFVLLVAVLLFWCRRKKQNNPDWRFLDTFKRKKRQTDQEKLYSQAKPQTDQEKLYSQAKSDTHLSGY